MAFNQACLCCCFFLFIVPGVGQAPEIVTDRPDITESSIVVPKGSLQFENGFTWTQNQRQQLVVSETLIRIGVANRTEFRIVVPNYLSSAGTNGGASGFGDLAFGVKQQIGPLPGKFDLSVIAGVSLPTGAREVSTGGYDPFLKFPWSRDIGRGWSVGGMQSVFWNTEAGRRNIFWEPTLYVEKQLGEPWDLFAEYGGDYPQRGGSKQIAHFGGAYRVTRTQQIDFHFGFGPNGTTLDRFFAFGYSFRVDRLF
jgi:hypothetical protein